MKDGGSSSGRTTDSDSVYLGSNPSPPAKCARSPASAGLRLLSGCAGKLARYAQRPVYEHPFELLAAVHPTQPPLGQPRDRAGAVGEESIEGIDCRAHEGNFTFSPALIRAQHSQRAWILALGACFHNQLRDGCCIQQTQVHSLARQRVNDVRRISDERAPLSHVAMGADSLQRESESFADQSCWSEREIRRSRELGVEISRWHCNQVGCKAVVC